MISQRAAALSILCVLALFAGALFGGCAGGGRVGPSAPDSVNFEAYQPNYGGANSVRGTNYFASETITYRIMGAGDATDLAGNPFAASEPTIIQRQAIRQGFAAWSEALTGIGSDGGPAPYNRVIREAAPNEHFHIKVAIVPPSAFGGTWIELLFTEVFGRASYYLVDESRPEIGQSLLRISSDLDSVRFQTVATHEAGHTLGMLGHSPNAADLMYPILRVALAAPSTLTTRDRNTVRAMYDRTPGPVTRSVRAPTGATIFDVWDLHVEDRPHD